MNLFFNNYFNLTYGAFMSVTDDGKPAFLAIDEIGGRIVASKRGVKIIEPDDDWQNPHQVKMAFLDACGGGSPLFRVGIDEVSYDYNNDREIEEVDDYEIEGVIDPRD